MGKTKFHVVPSVAGECPPGYTKSVKQLRSRQVVLCSKKIEAAPAAPASEIVEVDDAEVAALSGLMAGASLEEKAQKVAEDKAVAALAEMFGKASIGGRRRKRSTHRRKAKKTTRKHKTTRRH